MTPNESFDKPFEWDMSGLQLDPVMTDGFRIRDLIAGSPAAKAGLAVDDVITQVNGRGVTKRGLVELKQLLKQEGKVVVITATRDGKPIEVKLKLRRLV